ncbi:MAG TPA: cation:proton antiporter [Dokdonella sp.]|uniref:cation:proton antiporter n=1 Tax=Dokdonella sp. TaxID=2291710 RepID=UPI002CE6EC7E|nr:cation:proton antiporter [Dokdonella sp.]HUD42696.1 cation:proton antiporter [Dokdonella sp.]
MDTYKLALALIGLALFGATWLPDLLRRRPLTLPILTLASGAVLYWLPLPLPPADPLRFPVITERLSELAVLVALAGVGLRIDTRFGWRRWSLTWRLLLIAMPLTICAGWWLGSSWLGYGAATALLIGAVLAPTDPVLASDVQVRPPGEGGEDPVRLALTSEAGLNDGLAFPFVWLAVGLAMAEAGQPMDWQRWLTIDVAWRVLGGVSIGAGLGYGLMYLIFRSKRAPTLSTGSHGLAALAMTLMVYGIAELCSTYGFLAVFVAALVIRQSERGHAYHSTLELFAQQCERLLTALILLMLGGALVSGLLLDMGWRELAFGAIFVLLVRPLAGLASLVGTTLSRRERWSIAVFGVRGVGSLYYLAFALNHATFESERAIWGIVGLIVTLSVLLHGLSAGWVMETLDRWRSRSK